jgi:hypothetical protein
MADNSAPLPCSLQSQTSARVLLIAPRNLITRSSRPTIASRVPAAMHA